MFKIFKSLMHETHETQAANRNEPGAFLNACAKKGYAFLNKHYKNKKKARAYLDQYLEINDDEHLKSNGPGILIHIRSLAQDEIDKINRKPDLSFVAKLDLQEKPHRIQELVMETFVRKQEREKEIAAARPSMKK